MHDPAVLLLDEPYQGFDWQTYLAFWDLAGELRAAGTATVVISHLVFEQERFDRICHLTGGRIEEEAGRHAPAA
jgi:ABC-type multidrug transport system ATPase subunit